MAVRERLITYEEYDLFTQQIENLDRNFELIHGEMVEKDSSELRGWMMARMCGELYAQLSVPRRGRLAISVLCHIPDDDHNARQPDISYFVDDTRPIVRQGAVPLLPDLAIEVKSPNDGFVGLREKANCYLDNGSRLVWLVFPNERQIEIHTADAPIATLGIGDTLTGGDVLPGFALPLGELFKT